MIFKTWAVSANAILAQFLAKIHFKFLMIYFLIFQALHPSTLDCNSPLSYLLIQSVEAVIKQYVKDSFEFVFNKFTPTP